ELVPGGLAAGGLVHPHLGHDARHERGADLRHEPLVARQRDRPVEVFLGVPLALLAALVERAQLLDLAAVLPRPVEVERHVDVDLLTQRCDRLLVDDLDDLEVTDAATVVGENGVHQSILRRRLPAGAARRPRRMSAFTSILRRRTSLTEKSGRPSISLPKSPDAKW